MNGSALSSDRPRRSIFIPIWMKRILIQIAFANVVLVCLPRMVPIFLPARIIFSTVHAIPDFPAQRYHRSHHSMVAIRSWCSWEEDNAMRFFLVDRVDEIVLGEYI